MSAFVPVVLAAMPKRPDISRQSDRDDLTNFRLCFVGRYGDTSLVVPKDFDEGTFHRLMTVLGVGHV